MHRVAQNLVRDGVSYTDPRKKGFWNAVVACVLLIKNFQNGILACSITKIPLGLFLCKCVKHLLVYLLMLFKVYYNCFIT
jgi:hypothetical protein